MNEEFELLKAKLKSVNDMIDIKDNLVVNSVLLAPLKAMPVIGDLINSSTDALLNGFQKKKENELIDVILKHSTTITTDMVNDVEFIINYARVVEAVRRLATNDKVKFFGNLIRNGYLSGEHIDNSEFEECVNILNTMSYREIEYLVDYKMFCENGDEKKYYKTKRIVREKKIYNRWDYFVKEYKEKYGITGDELYYIFVKIKQTGFLEEEFESEGGNVDEDDYTFDALDVESTGFFITTRFLKFYDLVLKTEN